MKRRSSRRPTSRDERRGSSVADRSADQFVPAGRFSKLSDILNEIAEDGSRERIAVSDLLAAMDKRAIGALMFIFAVPNVLPTPPGTSAVLGAPLVFLAAQMTFGLRPWLPRLIADRSLARSDFAAIIRRCAPWLVRAERLLRPRMSWLTRAPFEYAVGALCFVLAMVLFLPIPLGNMAPALAICIFSLGIVESDGVWVFAGLGIAVGALALVSGMIYAAIASALFIIANAVG